MDTLPWTGGKRQPQNTNAPRGTCEKGLLTAGTTVFLHAML